MAPLVEQAGACQPGRRPADRGHGNAGGEEAGGGVREGATAALVPQLGAGQDEQVARGGIEVGEQCVGEHAHPPMVVTGSRDSATVTTSKGAPVKRPVRSSTRR